MFWGIGPRHPYQRFRGLPSPNPGILFWFSVGNWNKGLKSFIYCLVTLIYSTDPTTFILSSNSLKTQTYSFVVKQVMVFSRFDSLDASEVLTCCCFLKQFHDFFFFGGGGEGGIVVLHLFFPILRRLKKPLHCCEIGNLEITVILSSGRKVR